jgi:hypothetical protein
MNGVRPARLLESATLEWVLSEVRSLAGSEARTEPTVVQKNALESLNSFLDSAITGI